MKLENITSGMVVGSYKDMCALLYETPTNHRAKELQLRRWRIYFEFEQKGNKFRILEIYKKEEIKTEKLLLQVTSKDLTKILFLQWLLEEITENSLKYTHRHGMKTEPGIVKIEQRRLLYLLGILNEDGMLRLLERKDSETEKMFFSALTSKAYYRLLEILENLAKNKIVLVEKGYLIRRGAYTGFSTIEENKKIFEIYDEALREYGLLSMSDVFLSGLSKPVFKYISMKLEKELGIDWHEECYLFGGFPDRIATYIKRIKGFDLCQKALIQCASERSQERMRKFGLARWADYQKKKDIVFTKDWKNIELPEDFLEQIESFINRFIALSPVLSTAQSMEN